MPEHAIMLRSALQLARSYIEEQATEDKDFDAMSDLDVVDQVLELTQG